MPGVCPLTSCCCNGSGAPFADWARTETGPLASGYGVARGSCGDVGEQGAFFREGSNWLS